MVLRELNENDLESLIKLYKQLDGANGNFTAEDARKIWKTEIEGNKKIKYFGAVENGKVISTCYCLIIPFLPFPNAKPRNLKFRIANTLTTLLFSTFILSFSFPQDTAGWFPEVALPLACSLPGQQCHPHIG